MSFCCVFSNCDDAMKDNLGVALRHSQEQAESTYDHRTATQKRDMRFNLLVKRQSRQWNKRMMAVNKAPGLTTNQMFWWEIRWASNGRVNFK